MSFPLDIVFEFLARFCAKNRENAPRSFGAREALTILRVWEAVRQKCAFTHLHG